MNKKNLLEELEALRTEIRHLEAVIIEKHAKMWHAIQENDRLTLQFEPYIPEDDEDYGLSFFELKEANEDLTKKMFNYLKIISDKDEELNTLRTKRKYKKAGSVSFDFFPLSDWYRLSYNKWNPGMYTQLCVGPLRIDWFAA